MTSGAPSAASADEPGRAPSSARSSAPHSAMTAAPRAGERPSSIAASAPSARLFPASWGPNRTVRSASGRCPRRNGGGYPPNTNPSGSIDAHHPRPPPPRQEARDASEQPLVLERRRRAPAGRSLVVGERRHAGRTRLGSTGGRPACCRAAMVDSELSVLSCLMVDACVLLPPLVDLTVTGGGEPALVTHSFQAPSVSTAWRCPISVSAAF